MTILIKVELPVAFMLDSCIGVENVLRVCSQTADTADDYRGEWIVIVLKEMVQLTRNHLFAAPNHLFKFPKTLIQVVQK